VRVRLHIHVRAHVCACVFLSMCLCMCHTSSSSLIFCVDICLRVHVYMWVYASVSHMHKSWQTHLCHTYTRLHTWVMSHTSTSHVHIWVMSHVQNHADPHSRSAKWREMTHSSNTHSFLILCLRVDLEYALKYAFCKYAFLTRIQDLRVNPVIRKATSYIHESCHSWVVSHTSTSRVTHEPCRVYKNTRVWTKDLRVMTYIQKGWIQEEQIDLSEKRRLKGPTLAI